MDNQINKIRKQIKLLRSKMLEVEVSMRDRVNHDRDCTETSLQLMACGQKWSNWCGNGRSWAITGSPSSWNGSSCLAVHPIPGSHAVVSFGDEPMSWTMSRSQGKIADVRPQISELGSVFRQFQRSGRDSAPAQLLV